MQITTIGLDLAKHWFQVHGVDANGHVVEIIEVNRNFAGGRRGFKQKMEEAGWTVPAPASD